MPNRLRHPFTYLVPKALEGKVTVGRVVVVPFGTRAVHGLVIRLHAHPPADAPAQRLKTIHSVADGSLDEDIATNRLELSRWVAERYAAPLGQCMELVLPPTVGRTPRMQRRYVATELGSTFPLTDTRLNDAERRVIKRLRGRRQGLSPTTLAKRASPHEAEALRHLLDLGLVQLCDQITTAAPSGGGTRALGTEFSRSWLDVGDAADLETPKEATAWPDTIRLALESATRKGIALEAEHPARGWCLLQTIRQTKRQGRRVLIITGEIERAIRLASQLAQSGETPTLLHGGLSPFERASVWQAAQTGSIDILVGTRLAVFAPLPRLGLIWVEGEEASALKEEQSPRYHARDVAIHRAHQEGAIIVLSSKHLSLETWREIEQGTLWAAVYPNPESAPVISVVDVKPFPAGTLLTPALCEGIREALRRRELAILYLNRKGYASVLHCRDCGTMPQCNSCTVALTYHKAARLLRCHYCGRTKPLPENCHQCRSPHLEPVGSGTERLEEAIHRLFPQARLARLDSEAVRRRTQTRALSQLLGAREIDILIGTEMLFRLALTHRASFVGVPDADAGLHVSDFRSAERTYHALIDAVSLAEPASRGGSVLLQTRFPDHHALTSIVSADPAIFLQHERSFRELLQYPPFTHLIRLDVSGSHETVVARAASRWADLLRVMLVAENREVQGTTSKQGRQRGTLESETCGAASILGPSPAAKYFVRGRYSWQILIKSVDLSTGRAVVSKTLERLEREPRPGRLRFAVDVDPVTMA